MKTALIILVCLAVVLGIVTYFTLFSGTQMIEPTATATNQPSSTATLILPSSTASSSFSSSTAGAPSLASGPSAAFSASFSAPYPVAWTEGQVQFAITGATLENDQLTLMLNIQLGATAQCVPVNMRMVTDEEGDMAAPTSPSGSNFPLGSDGACDGAASGTYSGQNVVFTVDPTTAPFLFTTNAPANVFFEVSTTTGNGLQIAVPQQSG